MKILKFIPLISLLFVGLSFPVSTNANSPIVKKAIFAGGCFWCVEKDFDSVNGVTQTISGFTGGTQDNPSYKDVTSGGTGHYEAVEIEFYPSVVSYKQLVDLFWRSIDPTDDGGQFCDRGHSYRTAVFALDEEQARIAEKSKAEAQEALGMEIATQILDAGEFFPAGEYHQGYYQSEKRIITRFGVLTKAQAYKRYRKACGRDARVKELWGDAAVFAR